MLAIEDLSTVKTTDEASAAAAGKYEVIGREIDDKYIAQVKAQVVNQKAIDEMQDQISIVYTPLHGTGNIPARRVMKELGFTHVYVVPEQELPDGGFPTVSYPNPEAAEAFSLGLKLAAEKNADLVLATDPDADRLGVYVKDAGSGEYIPLTGNMSGSLLCEYVLSQKKAAGKIPDDGQVIKSIVSTNLIDAVAKEYGCELIEVLTGFKWIGQQVLKNEKTGRITMEPVAGSEKEATADLVLIAAGFSGCQSYVADAFGVKLDAGTNVETEAGRYKTNVERVFTAGDMRRGQSLVVWAIREGREAAKEVDENLMVYTLLE